jgi:hypothetical protein
MAGYGDKRRSLSGQERSSLNMPLFPRLSEVRLGNSHLEDRNGCARAA